MNNNWKKWLPKTSIITWRVLSLLLFCFLWVQDDGSEMGEILLLFLAIMTLARWRFQMPAWTVLIDQGACFVMMLSWPLASFGLVLPVFEGMVLGKYWFLLPIFGYIIMNFQSSFFLSVIFIQAGLAGWFLREWTWRIQKYQEEADRQRRDKYELETLKEELLLANIQAARMAELTERNRIAQELHDDVGHELTAAVLALQAFEQLWKEEDPSAEEIFYLAKQRLSNSAMYLRETVHDMKPIKELGVAELQDLCNQFTACPITFSMYGDGGKIPTYLWGILQPCLKEALTNIVRHTKATKVEVSLDINPHIVRLSIHNDGVRKENEKTGIGLRNLRQRAKAVGGSISVDTSDGFLLICVLPLDDSKI